MINKSEDIVNLMDSKELRGLMEAYSEVYAPLDIFVDEGYQRDPEGAERKKTHSKQPDPSKPGFTGIGNMSIDQIRKMSARIEKENTKKEEVDIFDTVLEYLVAEGYADNNQEALYIMANLSEEEILEYRKLAAGLVGGMMALNMMKPGVAPTGIKSQAPEPDKTELVSKADKAKKDAEERRQADLYAQSRVEYSRQIGMK
ncbi:MAG: hypothetical protein EBU90_02985 [Proteobacteria bacterium]|nr:hypothetical protein [Pseudomonadota bacterium]